MNYLLDSVILIDHFNGVADATALLREHGTACAVSVITRAEVLTGFTLQTEPVARELLDRFATLPITPSVADLAASLRRRHRWKLPDAFQAALATSHDLTLVTRNTRDFKDGDGARVWVPYTL